MAVFSSTHLLILAIIWIAWMVPLANIFGRIGYSKAWCLVAIIPPLGMVALWVIAFGRWRIEDATT
jgi:hypothetical protein